MSYDIAKRIKIRQAIGDWFATQGWRADSGHAVFSVDIEDDDTVDRTEYVEVNMDDLADFLDKELNQ